MNSHGKTNVDNSTQDSTLSPSTVIASLSITAPAGIVIVEGVVTRLSPYPRDNPTSVYGDLRDELGDTQIQFRCPINRSPAQVGEIATIRGGLSFQSRTKKEPSIRITGDCISQRQSVQKLHHSIQTNSTRPKIKLDEFVSQHGLDALQIIGTPIAIKDIRSGLQESLQRDCQTNTQFCNFNSPTELLETAKKALASGKLGILFARGGNDADTLQHWDNAWFINQLEELKCPIFTAIGHSNQLFLVEKYVSDDFFITPTAAGHAIGKALRAKSEKAQLYAKLSNMQQQLDAATKGSQQLKRVRTLFKYALVAIVVLGIALWLE